MKKPLDVPDIKPLDVPDIKPVDIPNFKLLDIEEGRTMSNEACKHIFGFAVRPQPRETAPLTSASLLRLASDIREKKPSPELTALALEDLARAIQ